MDIIRETLDLWSVWLPQRSSHTIKIIKSILWDDQVEYLVLNFHFDTQGWSNRPSTMIKSIIFFWPSTDDQFDYLEGCPIVDHHIWSTWPSRYSGWPSIFLRVKIQCTHIVGTIQVKKFIYSPSIVMYGHYIHRQLRNDYQLALQVQFPTPTRSLNPSANSPRKMYLWHLHPIFSWDAYFYTERNNWCHANAQNSCELRTVIYKDKILCIHIKSMWYCNIYYSCDL